MGLRIKSRVEGDEVVAEWRPEPHHQAFDGILNGGIAGALLDCHSNWTAAYHLMKKSDAAEPPCTVTAEFHITLKRPTPMDVPLHLRARVVKSTATTWQDKPWPRTNGFALTRSSWFPGGSAGTRSVAYDPSAQANGIFPFHRSSFDHPWTKNARAGAVPNSMEASGRPSGRVS